MISTCNYYTSIYNLLIPANANMLCNIGVTSAYVYFKPIYLSISFVIEVSKQNHVLK